MSADQWIQLAAITVPILVASLGYVFRTASERAKDKDGRALGEADVRDGAVAGPTAEERLYEALEEVGRLREEKARLEERARWLGASTRGGGPHGTIDVDETEGQE